VSFQTQPECKQLPVLTLPSEALRTPMGVKASWANGPGAAHKPAILLCRVLRELCDRLDFEKKNKTVKLLWPPQTCLACLMAYNDTLSKCQQQHFYCTNSRIGLLATFRGWLGQRQAPEKQRYPNERTIYTRCTAGPRMDGKSNCTPGSQPVEHVYCLEKPPRARHALPIP